MPATAKVSLPANGRRRLMRWLSGLGLAPLAAALLRPGSSRAALRPTPGDALGPFYPLDWSGDIDADLTRLGDAAAAADGHPLELSGTVRDTAGRPLADAVVEIWQADAGGRYRHPGVDPRTRDARFQGYGRALTDADGAYRFTTIVPGNYGSRPPHIHFRVVQPGRRELVTQMYFRGNNREGDGYAPPEREALSVELAGSEAGGRARFSARFDLVLPA